MPDPLAAERPGDMALLRRWVLASAVGELVGLGGVGLVAATLAPVVRQVIPGNVAGPLAVAALMTGLGAFEGAIVGTAQAWALRGTGVETGAWIRATLVGAVLAWVLGMVPSTVMALRAGHVEPGAGPPPWARLVLAAALGLVAGPILAGAQLRVLRRHVRRPWLWLVANALGWALGMPLVFAAVRNLALHGPTAASLAISALALALAGAAVGLVEGAFLVSLLRAGPLGSAPADI